MIQGSHGMPRRLQICVFNSKTHIGPLLFTLWRQDQLLFSFEEEDHLVVGN